MRDMFEKDDKRFDKFSLEFCNDLFLDYSKNIINEKTVELLLQVLFFLRQRKSQCQRTKESTRKKQKI